MEYGLHIVFANGMLILQQWSTRWRCRGWKRTPKRFDLLKSRAKSLKIRAKMAPKIWFYSKTKEKHMMTIFWRSYQKKVFYERKF